MLYYKRSACQFDKKGRLMFSLKNRPGVCVI